MKTLALASGVVLSTLVVAEGGYIVKTRREMDELRVRLEDITTAVQNQAQSAAGRTVPTFVVNDDDDGANGGSPEARAARPAPPRFVPQPTTTPGSSDPLPLPPGLESSEAREQLKQFVFAQVKAQREEERAARDLAREQAVEKAKETVAKTLGLSPDQSRKFNDLLASAQQSQRDLRDKLMSGNVPREQARDQFMALRTKTEADLKAVIGDDGLQKLDALRRQDDDVARLTGGLRGGGPGGGRGGGPWGGGGPGGGGPFGRGGPGTGGGQAAAQAPSGGPPR